MDRSTHTVADGVEKSGLERLKNSRTIRGTGASRVFFFSFSLAFPLALHGPLLGFRSVHIISFIFYPYRYHLSYCTYIASILGVFSVLFLLLVSCLLSIRVFIFRV